MLALLQTLTTQLRPVDEDQDEETREDQRSFRYGCGDVVQQTVGRLLGGAEALGAIMNLLGTYYQQYQANAAQWQGVEAALYCVRSVRTPCWFAAKTGCWDNALFRVTGCPAGSR